MIGTPIDLNRVIEIRQPTTRVTYDLQCIGTPSLSETVHQFLLKQALIHD